MAGFFVDILFTIQSIFSGQDKVKKIPPLRSGIFFMWYFIVFMQFSYFFYRIQKEFLTLLNKLIYY